MARVTTRRRTGVTLMEVLVTMTVISVLIASSAPTVTRTVEQAHVDYANASLHAIWNAQRLHWIEHRTYAADLATLESEGVLIESLDNNRYDFAVDWADDTGFSAVANRQGSNRWQGGFAIDTEGTVTGNVSNGSVSLGAGS